MNRRDVVMVGERSGLEYANIRPEWAADIARIELGGEEWTRLGDAELRARVSRGIRDAGFTYVSLDMEGFRSGRLNETLR